MFLSHMASERRSSSPGDCSARTIRPPPRLRGRKILGPQLQPHETGRVGTAARIDAAEAVGGVPNAPTGIHAKALAVGSAVLVKVALLAVGRGDYGGAHHVLGGVLVARAAGAAHGRRARRGAAVTVISLVTTCTLAAGASARGALSRKLLVSYGCVCYGAPPVRDRWVRGDIQYAHSCRSSGDRFAC